MQAETQQETQGRKRNRRMFSAKEKAEAVLALWSGRRNGAALTQELQVPWAVINHWEQRALNGMLSALDPSWARAAETAPSLPPRVERLLAKTQTPAPAPATN